MVHDGTEFVSTHIAPLIGEEQTDVIKAAAYVRMSTEHQQYSTSNQMDVIQEYAQRRGHEIVKVYSDEGKSGLNIQGRDSLAQMIRDVQAGQTEFKCILVYDVSRWGRFQDADESAFYEYICRKAGVTVHYCAEQFENDGSPVSTIVKGVKRAMAGEYSRELSSKVFQGACRLIQRGFRQGGTAGYGLRRMLVDQNGEKKATLKFGEQKSLQTDRVILVPGPEEEVKVVKWIYRMFIEAGKKESDIAAILNAKGLVTDFGRPWTRVTVHGVLTNEKYIGNNVYHRRSFKLKKRFVVNPPEKWVRAEGVYQGIIPPADFLKAREIILARSQEVTNEEMLEQLRGLWKEHGRLHVDLIDEREDLPSRTAYAHRFGCLLEAYRLIGYAPTRSYSYVEDNRRLRKNYPEIIAGLVRQLQAQGATVFLEPGTGLLLLNGELRVSLFLCRHAVNSAGYSRWLARVDVQHKPDLTIAVRMQPDNEHIRDYYLLPGIDLTWEPVQFAEDNGIYLDTYRFETLDFFLGLARREKIQDVL